MEARSALWTLLRDGKNDVVTLNRDTQLTGEVMEEGQRGWYIERFDIGNHLTNTFICHHYMYMHEHLDNYTETRLQK